MKLVMFPAVDDARLERIREAAGAMQVVNAVAQADAVREIADADAFFGKINRELLAVAGRLRWVQSPTASLEHYLFEELIEHPCMLSNMRGLFDDTIADHVMGFVLSLARNLHLYRDRQRECRWDPIGGEDSRPGFSAGPAFVSEVDRRHLHLADCTMGVVGVGCIGSEICRRAAAFGMRVLGVDPDRRMVDGIVPGVWLPGRLPDLLAESDFVVIAAPHTPETVRLFQADQFQQMKRAAFLINIGRGAAASPRIAQRHLDTLLRNIRCFVAGREPETLVDKSRWY